MAGILHEEDVLGYQEHLELLLTPPFPHSADLLFEIPVPSEVDVRSPECVAKWAYFGKQLLPLSKEDFFEHVKPGGLYEDLVRDQLPAMRSRATDLGENLESDVRERLGLFEDFLSLQGKKLKRLENYARYLGFKNYSEDVNAFYLRLDKFCQEKGVFSYKALCQSKVYFDLCFRLREPKLEKLFDEKEKAELRKVLAPLSPFWTDALIQCRKGGAADMWLEAFANRLLFLQRDEASIKVRLLGDTYYEGAYAPPFSLGLKLLSERDKELIEGIARQRLGDGDLDFLRCSS